MTWITKVHPATRVVQGLGEAFALDWFQQIVDRMNLECFQSKLVVSSDEYDQWQTVRRDGFDDFEAIHFRQLNIEEDQVGGFALDGTRRALAISAPSYDLDIRFGFEHQRDAFTRQRFVIDNQRLNEHLNGQRRSKRGPKVSSD